MDMMDQRRQKPDFTAMEYWDDRFQNEDTNDWLLEYNQMEDLIKKYVTKNDKILMLGCGNSKLSEEMYQDGYENITNIDFSSVCIEKMREKHAHSPGMDWLVMDIKDLRFPDCSFDVVLEKGTLDALLANEKDVWNVSDDGKKAIESALSQVSRVLRPNGIFFSITFSQPHFRRPLLARTVYHWSIELTILGEHFHFFFFTMRKGAALSEKDQQLEKETVRECSQESEADTRPTIFLPNDETGESFLSGFAL